jgi:dephospho-CoA kinase
MERRRPLRVALTGGIGSGKSYCLAQFARLGVPVIDADRLAHEAVAPGTPGLAAVTRRFGRSVTDASGQLNRSALASVVFIDADARRDLEQIIHPVVRAGVEQFFRDLPADAALGIADIPLLYETNRAKDFDRVIVALCSPDQQRERLRARGMAPADIERRLAAQLPLEGKARSADFVIDTSGTTAETDRQVEAVARSLGC